MSINSTIRHLGVKVLAARSGNTYLGYSYFVSRATGFQVGDSVMVYRQRQLSMAQWLAEAAAAAKQLPEVDAPRVPCTHFIQRPRPTT